MKPLNKTFDSVIDILRIASEGPLKHVLFVRDLRFKSNHWLFFYIRESSFYDFFGNLRWTPFSSSDLSTLSYYFRDSSFISKVH